MNKMMGFCEEDNMNRNSKSYKEEEKKLISTLRVLDRDINKYTLKSNKALENSYVTWSPSYEELESIRDYKESYYRYLEYEDELIKIRKKPYFGRVDISSIENKNEVFYFGEKSIEDYGKYIVWDWRFSHISDFYYNKGIQEFKKNGFLYEVLLRRSIIIENSEITSIYDDFIKDDSIKSRINDPFLLKVLDSKRDIDQITNIISTIQIKQYDIIKEDLDNNLIIQGCAGSGKTMILVHRLSYLLFNNNHLDSSNCLIITPNENLNMQLSELAHELEINKIERTTLKGYFLDIEMKYLTLNIENEEKRNKFIKEEKLKLAVVNEDVFSKLFLNYFYSQSLLDDMNTFLKEYLLKSFSKILDVTLYNLNVKDINYDSMLRLIYKLKDNKAKIEPLKNKITRDLNKLNKDFENYLKNTLLPQLKKEIESKKLNYILKNKNKIKKEMELLQQEKNKTSIYRLFKHRQIDKNILEKTNEIKLLTVELEKEKNLTKSQKNSSPNLKILQQKIEQVEGHILLSQNCLQKDELYISRIRHLINSLITDNPTSKFDKFGIDYGLIYSIKSTMVQINEVITNIAHSPTINRTLTINGTLTKIIKEYDELKSIKIYNEDVYINLDQLLAKFNNKYIVINDIANRFITQLKDAYYIDKNKKFYFESIIKIWFFNQFNIQLKNKFKYLFIDEGQDISLMEYQLLNIINNKLFLNIFGDLNQKTNSTGLDSWKSLDKLNFKYFELNENYRNASQITEYINNNLDMNMIPIGVNGKIEINKYGLELEKYFENLDLKILIVKNEEEYKKIKNKLLIFKKMVTNELFSTSDLIDKDALNIISVEMVKGLEFKKVVVINNGMNKNEMYISYTRALNELDIVNVD
jgi:DNA helicase IV